eukprot:13799087-Ditylum_brightwellii.AAC.1
MAELQVYEYLQSEGHTIEVVSPFTLALLVLATLLFVDDVDLLSVSPSSSATRDDLLPTMQASINTWEGGLIATGGALKHNKCKFQTVGFKWRDGHWTNAKPLTPPILKIQ